MSRGVNKVILVGNLGNDPETKYTQGGMAICTLSIATTSSRKNKDGEREDKTEWHRCKAFGKTAEICDEYLRKGKQVYIEGRIEYGSYEKDGVKHYTTDIIVDEMQMLGSRDDGERSSGPSRSQAPRREAPPARGGPPQRSQRQATGHQPEARNESGDDFADDDIPF